MNHSHLHGPRPRKTLLEKLKIVGAPETLNRLTVQRMRQLIILCSEAADELSRTDPTPEELTAAATAAMLHVNSPSHIAAAERARELARVTLVAAMKVRAGEYEVHE